jgi:NADH dehydrogenase
MNPPIDVVTGAFSYSGRFVAAELLERGRGVRTLTNHPNPRDPLAPRIPAQPLEFEDSASLESALAGADTLYNTYWVRAPRVGVPHTIAVQNTKRLIEAARRAGIRRIVHTSIANPTASRLSYYRGKAELEEAVRSSSLSYAIVRPTLLFGEGDVLINNIAWLLRHLPVFGVGGKGDYRIRPMHIDDLAALAVSLGAERTDTVVDAVGPDRPSFLELVQLVREAVGSRSLILRVPRIAVPALASMLGLLLRDVLLTGDEFRAMADGMADTDGPATGTISVMAWIRDNADALGRSYANEIERHFKVPGR